MGGPTAKQGHPRGTMAVENQGKQGTNKQEGTGEEKKQESRSSSKKPSCANPTSCTTHHLTQGVKNKAEPGEGEDGIFSPRLFHCFPFSVSP